MGTRRSGSEIRYWGMLFRPRATFQALVAGSHHEGHRHDVAILPMIGAGAMGLLFWADLFDLGRFYETGRIFSGGLILGPLIGIAWLALMSLSGLWLGNLLDRRHRSHFQYRILIPPFPLKNLLWVKVLGVERLRRLFSLPVLRHCLQAWSWSRAAWTQAVGAVSGGEVSFALIFSSLVRLARIFLPMLAMVWLSANLASQNGFGAEGEGSSLDGPMLALKGLFFIVFVFFWLQFLRAAFQLDWPRTLFVGLASVAASLALVLWLLSFLTGIRLM